MFRLRKVSMCKYCLTVLVLFVLWGEKAPYVAAILSAPPNPADFYSEPYRPLPAQAPHQIIWAPGLDHEHQQQQQQQQQDRILWHRLRVSWCQCMYLAGEDGTGGCRLHGFMFRSPFDQARTGSRPWWSRRRFASSFAARLGY